jgi:hypothetical protein
MEDMEDIFAPSLFHFFGGFDSTCLFHHKITYAAILSILNPSGCADIANLTK